MNTPLIPVWIIWFAGVCEEIQAFLYLVGGIGLAIVITIMIIYYCYNYGNGRGGLNFNVDKEQSEEIKKFTKKNFKIVIILIVVMFIATLIPSEKTMYTMIFANQVTPKNVKLINNSVKDTTDYLFKQADKLIKGK